MKQALEKFKSFTGCDIESFFKSYATFTTTYYPNIVSYYTGGDVDIKNSFSSLDALIQLSCEIEPLFTLRQNSLDNIDFWEILDLFTECQTKLWTIKNSSRWLRSTVVGRSSNGVVMKRMLRTGETFEDVMVDLGSNAPQEAWVNVSRDNFIEEEDYSSYDGGGMFKINITEYGNFDVMNIVDNLSDEKILGKDIDVNFHIIDNDLARVEYDLAISQALNTIIRSFKGSIPEYRDYGLPNEMVGTSINAIQYPSIFKHLLNMFQRDQRWVEINLLDVYIKDDNLFFKINARTITNNFLITNIQI